MSPHNPAELAELITAKNERAEKISAIDLRKMNRILELTPADMTVTVESGITLDALQRELRAHGQWLPIDPPSAERLSIHELLSRNLSGPRRFGYGTIREHLIGMKIVLADGRTIKSGGKVVKNVAGYDLAKLLIGARDSLGIIVEATFKVRPLPETERFVSMPLARDEANDILRTVLDSDLMPVVLDMYRVGNATAAVVVLGFAGTRVEVEWQLGMARSLGFVADVALNYEAQFWNDTAPVNSVSVLPSRINEVIAGLGARPFVARAGNGVIYSRGEKAPSTARMPVELMQRIKMAYDPKNILPEFTP